MPSNRPTSKWWLTALLTIALALGLVPFAAPSATAAGYATPSGLRSLSTSRDAVSLSWNAVKGAPKYRVQYSTSKSMKNSKYVRVDGTQVNLKGLKSNTTYYVKVRVISKSGGNLSSYSKAIKVKTRSSGSYRHLAPVGLKAGEIAEDGFTLSWAAVAEGVRYRIAYATSSGFADPVYRRVDDLTQAVTGLKAGKTYYVKVRVIDAEGGNLSAYSPVVKVSTKSGAKTDPPAELGPAPSGLKIERLAQTTIALSWKSVKGAAAYRVEAASSQDFADPIAKQFTGTYGELGGLTKGTTYYLRIAVATAKGSPTSEFSKPVTGTTPTAAADLYLTPTNLQVTSTMATRIVLTWDSRGEGMRYQVRYATDPKWEDAQTSATNATSLTLTGLRESTTYYLQVRVVSSSGSAQSRFGPSPAVKATTRAAGPTGLTIASYNVKCANCYSALPEEGTWYERRDSVVSAIQAQAPDVIGIQEASQGWLKDAKGNSVSLAQFEDLEDRLGSPYKVTNSYRNNCVKSTTPSNCVYKDRGASQGTRIFYNDDTVKLIDQGSRQLSEVKASDNDRYVAWAIFEDRKTSRRFFFADTHLEPTADASGKSTYYELRITQAKELLETVAENNPDSLPTFIVGDLNSSKRTSPSNGPYDTILAGGYVDPLGNYYQSTNAAKGATVEKRINSNFSSYNGFKRKAPSTSWINGTNIDYILTSRNIRVVEWETYVAVDDEGNFIGRIPSDHNMLRATVVIPAAAGN